MQTTRPTLAEFVTGIMKEKGLSVRAVAANTRNRISHSTVADIASGQRLNPSIDTLTDLAVGLGIPPEQLGRVIRGLHADPDPQSRFEIYAERFDAHDLDETEWQFLEGYFKDQVELFKRAKAQRDGTIDEYASRPYEGSRSKPLAPVVARIEPGERKPTRDDVRRMISTDDIAEIEKRVTPRKKKKA